METLNVSPAVLEWAASKIGRTLTSIAEELVAERNRANFISGELSVRQLEKFAALTSTPFGYLFLDAPPKIERPKIPDMRQTKNPEPLGKDFFDVLEDITKKQEWYLDYLKEVGAEPLEFVGKFNKRTPPKAIANDIAQTAKITKETRFTAKSTEDYYRALAEKFESIGILVFKSGVVKNNPKKGLSVAEFRGFALCNSLAPTVFINGKDAEAAWIFTLAHEVAHIWIGESGVSDIPSPSEFNGDSVEYLCNKVAAELLTPTEEFLTLWSQEPAPSIESLSRHFKVSRLVVARRAFDLGKIDRATYMAVYERSWKIKSSTGGSPYKTIPVRNSKKLTNALVRSAMEGNVLIRDAARLLNVAPDTVANLYRKNLRSHV